MSDDNLHIEEPFVFGSEMDILKRLVDIEKTKKEIIGQGKINAQEFEAKKIEPQEFKAEETMKFSELLKKSQKFDVNTGGEPVAVLDKYNIKLHKYFLGTLKVGYGLISILKTGNVASGKTALGGLFDYLKGFEKIPVDEWQIVDIIQTFSFRHARITLKAPGPTLDEIETELENQNSPQDDLKGKLDGMINKGILKDFTVDSKTYYQVEYLSDWLPE